VVSHAELMAQSRRILKTQIKMLVMKHCRQKVYGEMVANIKDMHINLISGIFVKNSPSVPSYKLNIYLFSW